MRKKMILFVDQKLQVLESLLLGWGTMLYWRPVSLEKDVGSGVLFESYMCHLREKSPLGLLLTTSCSLGEMA
jgi:hypothetical protein